MSFRLKTILGVALIEVTLLVVLVWNGMMLMRNSGEEQLIRQAETTSALFASMVKDPVLSYDLATLETFVVELMKNPGLVYVRIYDQDQLLASGGEEDWVKRPFLADYSLDSVIDAVFDIRADIVESEQHYGHVELGISTQQLQERLSSATWKTSGLAMAEILLSALFSFLLGSWLVKQLEILRQASRAISDGQLGVQVPVKGKDEIAETASHFNQMSVALQQSTDALNRLNSSLEEQVEERTQQLQYANQSLESILQSMSEVLLVIDEQGEIQLTNPASQRLLGFAEDQLINQDIHALLSDEEDKGRLDTMVAEQIQTGEEFLLLTTTGERLPVLMMASRIEDQHREEGFTVITAQDLRELKRAEEGERYLSFQEGLNEMSANILHNIGNNLTGIQGGLLKIEKQSNNLKQVAVLLGKFSGSVMDEVEKIGQQGHAELLGPSIQKAPQVLEKSSQSIQTMLEQEVDLSVQEIEKLACHIQSVIKATPLTAKGREHSKEFDLSNLLQDVDTILSDQVQQSGVTIHQAISLRVEPLHLSRNLLLQALVHLVSNSIEAIDAETDGKVTISADQIVDDASNHWLVLEVIDNGRGIDEALLSQVGRSGFTTKTHGGGHGLHAVGNYVNSIGGDLKISNRTECSGLVVSLSLPL